MEVLDHRGLLRNKGLPIRLYIIGRLPALRSWWATGEPLAAKRQLFPLWLGLVSVWLLSWEHGRMGRLVGKKLMKRTKKRQTAVLALSMLALTLTAPWGFGQDPEPPTELRRQAEQGDTSAQFNLGFRYNIGQGVPQDDAEAARWYRLAAEQGDYQAQIRLVDMYSLGFGGAPQNDAEAARWYHLAAEQGNPGAQVRPRSHVRQRRGRVPGRPVRP